MRLSIVIPTLNEEPVLPLLLANARCTVREGDQLIISDGGSSDATLETARAHGAEVVCGAPGRGLQLNRGVRAATGEILLFLHADTELPATAAASVRRAIAAGAVGGAFTVRFDSERAIMRFGSWLVRWRTRLTGCPLGDQAQFVRRDVFERLGGFRDWPILEDLDFARRLKRAGRTVVLDDTVLTSARRYRDQGIARTIVTNWLIWLLYFLGVSPHRLARLYGQIR